MKKKSHNNQPGLILICEIFIFTMHRLYFSEIFLNQVANGNVKILSHFRQKALKIKASYLQ